MEVEEDSKKCCNENNVSYTSSGADGDSENEIVNIYKSENYEF